MYSLMLGLCQHFVLWTPFFRSIKENSVFLENAITITSQGEGANDTSMVMYGIVSIKVHGTHFTEPQRADEKLVLPQGPKVMGILGWP